jgi:TetR/AcrR family transcriptional regulator
MSYIINRMVKPISKTSRVKKAPPEERILKAAREEFVGQGLKGARMQAIADRAGVNKALLHYYFRTKEKLYAAALADIVTTIGNGLRTGLGARTEDEDLRSLLRQVVTVYVNTLQKNPEFPRFMARELLEGGTRLKEIVDLFINGFGDIPARIYAQIVREEKHGAVRRVKPLHLALNIVSMSVFAFIARPLLSIVSDRAGLKVTLDGAGFTGDRIDSIFTMVCDGIFKEKAK